MKGWLVAAIVLAAITAAFAAEKKTPARAPSSAGTYFCSPDFVNPRDLQALVQANCESDRDVSLTSQAGYVLYCCISRK